MGATDLFIFLYQLVRSEHRLAAEGLHVQIALECNNNSRISELSWNTKKFHDFAPFAITDDVYFDNVSVPEKTPPNNIDKSTSKSRGDDRNGVASVRIRGHGLCQYKRVGSKSV